MFTSKADATARHQDRHLRARFVRETEAYLTVRLRDIKSSDESACLHVDRVAKTQQFMPG